MLDKNTLSYSLLIAPPWLSIDSASGTLSGTPNLSMSGNVITDTISFKAEDASGNFVVYDYPLNTYKINPLAISEQNEHPEFIRVYPDPTKGKFTVEAVAETVEFEICNMLGEKIYRSEIHASRSVIDISAQPNGIYFVHVKTTKGRDGYRNTVRKIIKE